MSVTTFPPLLTGAWQLDPARSSLEFSVPHFYGLMKVRGRFESFAGSVDLDTVPAVELTVDAASINTGNRKRDEHLRSKDFFKVSDHPTLSFTSTSAEVNGDTLQLRGMLRALGNSVTIELPLQVVAIADGLQVEGSIEIDQRQIGLTWSPLGLTRTPTTVSLRGRLVR
jgi:polyisoprenoid-binding protein YceI